MIWIMINKLNIKGLKCFNEVELTLKNLTLLAGKIQWENQRLFKLL